MHSLKLIYRDQMVRAVGGTKPAVMAKEADITGIDRFCQRLVDAEEAIGILVAKGYGIPSQSLADLVRTLPRVKLP